jgi:hypothetical protein
MPTAELLSLEVEDFTGQMRRRATGISTDATIGELLEGLTWSMDLPEQDASGRPIRYSARTADGEALNPTDVVGDVLKPEQRVTISPSVTAG